MRVQCPHCQRFLNVKVARPGHFAARCSACGKPFEVDLRGEAGEPLQATLPPEPALAPAPAAARPAAPRPAVGATMAPAPAPPPTEVAAAAAPTDPGLGEQNVTAPPPTQIQSAAKRLGGYELLDKLGEGGMGAVYLARQVSLDRKVALKVLTPQLAADPGFVARFTREAYAAAQLSHHNIVAIHDIGTDQDQHFFSMEFVIGQNLGQAMQASGKIDPESATGYALQAARGLQFAHEHGMIHRDIKPENLLLNEQGIVKVADLGLVKRAGVQDVKSSGKTVPSVALGATQMNVAMGTPAYMPPEQAADAAHVDQRADIYSLGCTLYALLTGRPPFMGRTAVEVINKHAKEPITPPDMIVRSVPRSLSNIVMRMVARKPGDRYPAMTQVVSALEDFLGVASSGQFSPKQEQIKIITEASERFGRSPMSVLRLQLAIAFYVAAGVGAALLAGMNHPIGAGAVIGFAVLTTLFYHVIVGVRQKTYLLASVRSLIFGASIVDWLIWLAGIALVVLLLNALGWLLTWLGVSLLALGLAAAFHFTIDALVIKDRAPLLEQVEALLKQMRRRGVDENTIRHLLFKFSGERWEELYETVFDYPAKIKARQLWLKGDQAANRKKYAAWRDGIIQWIESKQAERRERREEQMLEKIEEKALVAQGVSAEEAHEQARSQARRLINGAAKFREQNARPKLKRGGPTPPENGNGPGGGGNGADAGDPNTVFVPADWMKSMSGPARPKMSEEDFERERISWFRRRFGTPLDLLFGTQLRFLLAVIFLAGFGLWSQQNKALSGATEFITSQRQIETNFQDLTAKKTLDVSASESPAPAAKPLDLPWLPASINRPLSGFNAGLAGLILLISCASHGRLMAFVVLISAAVVAVGHWYSVPGLGYPHPWMSAAAGALLAAFSMVFLRSNDTA